MTAQLSVGLAGIVLPGSMTGSFDVYFDAQHVWSFSRDRRTPAPKTVTWPRPMVTWLDGVTQVEIRHGDEHPIFAAEVRFGDSTARVEMVDGDGVPVMIDKWGLIQRPFSGRGEGVVEQLVEISEETLRVLRADLGLHAWMAFGTLLGAAREGGVIAHDSDVDLAYLSHSTTPAGVNREIFAITRALRAAGLRVINKSGGFVTVAFKAPDGGPGSLDVYACFYVDDLLHETATIRARVPASAIEPLGTLAFEGRELPAPADPERMLAVSYGPGWRVPDPSFQHRPGQQVSSRFDDWLGDLMQFRRAWERVHRDAPDATLQQPTDFGLWVREQGLPAGSEVIDIGCGLGSDVLHHARNGHSATGLDFARGAFGRASAAAKRESLSARFIAVNIADLRDALSATALLMRLAPGPRVVTSTGLLDTLAPVARNNFWSMLRMLLRGGGTAMLEFAHELDGWKWDPALGGKRKPVPVAEVVHALEGAGASITTRQTHRTSDGLVMTRLVAQW